MSKLIVFLLAAGLLFWFWRRWQRQSRLDFIERSPLPRSLRPQLIAQYPDWGEAQLQAVEKGLRQFFRVCAQAPGQFTAMPSKAVDAAWHACILDTRAYERYCRNAFGRLLHHTPAEALPAGQAPARLKAGLRRAWLGACRDERLDPFKTGTLPLLFALDAQLAIAGGYHYVPDCRLLGLDRGDTHCGSALACGGGGGSSDGDGGSDGGGDGGGCGGGD
jgi:hypothetical protein